MIPVYDKGDLLSQWENILKQSFNSVYLISLEIKNANVNYDA